MDNIFVEWLWRSPDYEDLPFETDRGPAAAALDFHNPDARIRASPAGRPTRTMLWHK